MTALFTLNDLLLMKFREFTKQDHDVFFDIVSENPLIASDNDKCVVIDGNKILLWFNEESIDGNDDPFIYTFQRKFDGKVT